MKRAEDEDIPCLLMSCDVRASRWSTDTGWTVLIFYFRLLIRSVRVVREVCKVQGRWLNFGCVQLRERKPETAR